jgi:hypothetical protein
MAITDADRRILWVNKVLEDGDFPAPH